MDTKVRDELLGIVVRLLNDGVTTRTSECDKSPIRVGNSVLIRTVTHYFTGRIVGLSDSEVLIEEAAWVADGRFADALQNGVVSELEPYPDGVVSINRGSIIDVSTWTHSLLRVQK